MTIYTVRKLAKISGVSVRTLHWYDEIQLLKPSYIDDNGYRYYKEERLLLLQQILFFRELGFKLSDIQKMLKNNDFDKTKALEVHKAKLLENINRQKKLLHTIDTTIMHLKGEYNMQDKELYAGFDQVKQKEYEEYLVKSYGTVAEELIAQSLKRSVNWGSKEWNEIKDTGNKIYAALSEYIKAGLSPRDDKVQALIKEHYKMIENFYDVTKDVYTGLAQLYVEHPGFRKFFDAHNTQLPEFIAEAMRVYAQKNL